MTEARIQRETAPPRRKLFRFRTFLKKNANAGLLFIVIDIIIHNRKEFEQGEAPECSKQNIRMWWMRCGLTSGTAGLGEERPASFVPGIGEGI
ncbi:MAG: hypothetical protein L6W00_21840 [Lentisphaeria bacterium]|nr:MAG: hypothetical protein L6W00_21840 [Lentisphaeria bacterium]